jgi:hypothetical protein
VTVAAALALGLRAPFVSLLPGPDEGGLLVVARHWHEGGPNLYGGLFVDRPPLLLLLFQVGSDLGGIAGVRVLGLALVALLVVAAGRSGYLVGGRAGAAAGAFVAVALVANPMLGTLDVTAETLGAPFTMVGCALLLQAVLGAPTRWRPVLVATAGASAVCALLVKQDLADALAFGVALSIASAWSGGRPWRGALADLGSLTCGALVPVAVVVAWAATETPGISSLWFTVFQFRVKASGVLLAQSTAAPEARLVDLARAALLSGLLVVLLVGAWLSRGRLRRGDPVTLAILAMLAAELVGVLGGGSYWTHYLLGLIPGVSLLAARAAGGGRSGRLLAVAVALTVGSSVLSSGSVLPQAFTPSQDSRLGAITTWLDGVSRPGDTGLVMYGAADLFATTRLQPEYTFLWTLPMRTLDPRLHRLARLLDHGDAPTFVIQPMSPDAWGLDSQGLVRAALERRYRRIADVCGVPVYLRDSVQRSAPAVPTRC